METLDPKGNIDFSDKFRNHQIDGKNTHKRLLPMIPYQTDAENNKIGAAARNMNKVANGKRDINVVEMLDP